MAHQEHVPAIRRDHHMRTVPIGQVAAMQDEIEDKQLVTEIQRDVSLRHRQRGAGEHVRDARVREGLLLCTRGPLHRPQRHQARRRRRSRLVRLLAPAWQLSSHGRHRMDHFAHSLASTERRACQGVRSAQVNDEAQRGRLRNTQLDLIIRNYY